MSRRHFSAVILAFALVIGSVACAGARNTLGTSASPCFRALPLAQAAAHDQGRLVGVRRVNTSALKGRLKDDPKVQAVPNQELCVFAFRGSYPPGQVDGASNTKPGHYAVIVVTSKHPGVVVAFVTDKLPTRFAHLH